MSSAGLTDCPEERVELQFLLDLCPANETTGNQDSPFLCSSTGRIWKTVAQFVWLRVDAFPFAFDLNTPAQPHFCWYLNNLNDALGPASKLKFTAPSCLTLLNVCSVPRALALSFAVSPCRGRGNHLPIWKGTQTQTSTYPTDLINILLTNAPQIIPFNLFSNSPFVRQTLKRIQKNGKQSTTGQTRDGKQQSQTEETLLNKWAEISRNKRNAK